MAENDSTGFGTASAVSSYVVAPLVRYFSALRSEHPITLDIPEYYCKKIGQMISIWAYVDWLLTGILCDIVGIGRKESRILFTGRTIDLWNKIKSMMALDEISIRTDLAIFAANLREGEMLRNLVAHTVWMHDKDTGELCLQNPTGEWTDGNKPIGSKRRDPEAIYPDNAWFDEKIEKMNRWLKDTQRFAAEIRRALESSQDKDALQTPSSQYDLGQNPESKV